jgi:hypothetical protein
MIKEIDKICPEEGTPDLQTHGIDLQIQTNNITG